MMHTVYITICTMHPHAACRARIGCLEPLLRGPGRYYRPQAAHARMRMRMLLGGKVLTGRADSDERGGGDGPGPGRLAASSCCLCMGRSVWGAGAECGSSTRGHWDGPVTCSKAHGISAREDGDGFRVMGSV